MGLFSRKSAPESWDWRNDRVASLNDAARAAGDEFWSQTAARVLGRRTDSDGMLKGSISDEEAQHVISQVRQGKGRR